MLAIPTNTCQNSASYKIKHSLAATCTPKAISEGFIGKPTRKCCLQSSPAHKKHTNRKFAEFLSLSHFFIEFIFSDGSTSVKKIQFFFVPTKTKKKWHTCFARTDYLIIDSEELVHISSVVKLKKFIMEVLNYIDDHLETFFFLEKDWEEKLFWNFE